MLTYILLGITGLVVVLLIVIASRPASFRVERSTRISAPPDVVFAQINDFHRWPAWSPWEKLDPNMNKTYEGPEQGVGACYAWSGNDKVGEGKMTMTKSEPHQLVALKLEFFRPWKATNDTEFLLEPAEKGTDVTWAMTGTNNFMSKALTLVMDMDKLLGKDFENGLAEMKRVSEAQAVEGDLASRRVGPILASSHEPQSA